MSTIDVENIEIQTITDEGAVNLSELLKEGPVVLNFIIGTWCPTCNAFIQNLLNVANEKKISNIYIVSTQSQKALKHFFCKGETVVPFGVLSDHTKSLINAFHLKIPVFGFARPASILLFPNGSYNVLSKGLPNDKEIKEVIECKFVA